MSKKSTNVPNLRFPGFEGEWMETTLGDCSQSLDYGMNAAAVEFDGENKYIRITDIDESTSKYISDLPVSPEGELEEKYLVKENDILFARTGASTGKTYLYHTEDGKLYFAGFLIRAKINSTNNACFIFNQTKTSFYNKWVKLTSMRSGQPGINSQEYASFRFWIPSKQEQDKIASFLSLIDDRISTQNKIIAQLQTLMQVLGEHLFKQQIRFKDDKGNDFPDWEEKRLGEVCEKAKSGGTPKSTVKEYYDGDIPFLSISDMTQQGKYLYSTEKSISKYGLDNSTSWIVPKNSIIYSMYASVGFVSINKIELATSQAVLNIILKSNIYNEYLYYYLDYYREFIGKYITTGTQGNLNAETVKSFEIVIPSMFEQQKIANFLSSIDKKIETEKKILQQYESQKKCLLQNIFI